MRLNFLRSVFNRHVTVGGSELSEREDFAQSRQDRPFAPQLASGWPRSSLTGRFPRPLRPAVIRSYED
jgi:hypothetical protein